MPFNSAGVYTPAAGATTAAPGDIIRSSVWNDIFNDLTAAMTLLGQQLYGTTPVASTPYVPVSADSLLLVNFAGAVVINLPLSSTRNGYPLAIKDISGAVAPSNTITINKNTTDTIEGLSSITISTDWGGYFLVPVSGGWIIRP